MIDDRLSLRTAFQAYIKRTFPDETFSAFLQIAHDRIFRDIRPSETLIQTTIVPTTTLLDLPSDYIDTRELSYLNGSRRVVLTSVGRHRFARSASQTGLPGVYSIVGDFAEVAPTTLPAEFTLWYWQKLPQLVADTDSNVILVAYPYLYLYGLLIEGNTFIQEGPATDLARSNYVAEFEQVNVTERRRRFGEAPLMGVA